eukprot:3656679-Rhodomonas_salina.1
MPQDKTALTALALTPPTLSLRCRRVVAADATSNSNGKRIALYSTLSVHRDGPGPSQRQSPSLSQSQSQGQGQSPGYQQLRQEAQSLKQHLTGSLNLNASLPGRAAPGPQAASGIASAGTSLTRSQIVTPGPGVSMSASGRALPRYPGYFKLPFDSEIKCGDDTHCRGVLVYHTWISVLLCNIQCMP